MNLGNLLKNVTLSNWRDNLSWLSGWVFYGVYTNVYGYTLNKIYGVSWLNDYPTTIIVSRYCVAWVLNFFYKILC